MRQTQSLNGPWRCTPDPRDQGRRLGYHRVDFEFMDRLGSGYGERMWREVEIPCCYSHCGPDMRLYSGVAWFRRSFTVPADWRDKHVFIRFEALNFLSRVWINDQLATTSYDGLARLDLRVDRYLKFGAENTIIISTDNRERPDDRSPGMGLGYYLSGGIVGDVTLIATHRTYLEGARFAFAEPSEAGGTFALNVTMANTAAATAELAVALEITDQDGRAYGTFKSEPCPVAGGKSKVATIRGAVNGVAPWDPQSPQLYHADVTLLRDGQRVDRLVERFGFRRLEIRNKRIYLNGQEFFLKGITLHNDYGFFPSDSDEYEVAEVRENTLTDNRVYYPSDSKYEPGLRPHREALLRDLKLIKGLGCNYVRLGHFPRVAPELDLFDEMGLLCSVENNLHWWQNDYACKRWGAMRITDRHVRAIRRHTMRQLRKMILRDMNHPSVACWVISNECRPGKKGVVDTIQAAVKLARRLDPSRFATHAAAEWHSESFTYRSGCADDFGADDIISINCYASFDINWWAKELAVLRKRYPDKPIVCTEFPHRVPVREPSLMTILQEMGGYLAGFCLYVFTGVVPGARARLDPSQTGKIVRASYGLFDRRRKPVLRFQPEAKPVRFEVGDRYALLPSAVLQTCKTRDELYRRELEAYKVREICDDVHSPLVTKPEGEKTNAAEPFGFPDAGHRVNEMKR
ncbi:MAG: hypothetical protein HY321_22300 [Armatimonadetes bacterium]|nr:hypothetical protein [Armatimonadota bacterium]